MKNLYLVTLLMFLTSCASMSLSENIRVSEAQSSHRITATGIQTGVHEQILQYVGESLDYYPGCLVYEMLVDEVSLKVLVPQKVIGYMEMRITDKPVRTKQEVVRKPLTVIFAKKAPSEIILGDIVGDNPRIYIGIRGSKEWVRENSIDYTYDSLRGRATAIIGNRLVEMDLSQDLNVETTVKFGTAGKSLGYFVTIPFDVITSPIQGVWIVIALGGILGGG